MTWQFYRLLLRALDIVRNEKVMNSWFAFRRAAQDIVPKTITPNHWAEHPVLDQTLFRGNEMIWAGSEPFHVLRVFTKRFPNVRGGT